MFSLNDSMRYLLYSEPTDMRKSYHTLSGLVTNNLRLNVLDGDVFIFINKSRNRIKLLHMEPGGLVIYSKLLEEGRFRLPSKDLYILIEKYTTFSLKSIPLIKSNQLLWSRSSNTKQDDKYGFETRDYKALFTRG